jgi:uncharacterized membrane protein
VRRPPLLVLTSLVALVLTGAIFGFFYAWVCSTMWGLDDADPRVAIAAMQAMNASVRNAVFFPAFFLTPVALCVAAGVAHRYRHRASAALFLAAAGIYTLGGLLLTMAINVPMNETLGAMAVPESREAAALIWADYSGRWQRWNITRTVASGTSLVLATLAILALRTSSTDKGLGEAAAHVSAAHVSAAHVTAAHRTAAPDGVARVH